MPVNVSIVATVILNAITSLLVLTLVALGLWIIFGLMGVINLAHGAFVTLGAYTVWLSVTQLKIGFWPSLILAPILVGMIGYITERLVIRHLYGRLMDTILATWGIALVIQEAIKLLVGETNKSVGQPPFAGKINLLILKYPTYRIFVMLFSFTILVGVFYLLRTNLGIRIRAVIQNDEMASLLGINKSRMYTFSFVGGAALAGLAGAVVAPIAAVGPEMGSTYLLSSFLAVITGGANTILGVVPGSIIIGGLSNVLTFSIRPLLANSLVYVMAIVLILIRPQGIFGGEFE